MKFIPLKCKKLLYNILVPARTISDFYVRVKNSEKNRDSFHNHTYAMEFFLGNAIVSNNNNKAYIKIFNTNTQRQKLTVPSVRIYGLSIHEEKQTDTKTNLEDKKINPQNIKIGDSVFLLEGGELKKFQNQYSGPYEVLEILGKGNIKISFKNKPKIVNINRLRLSYITPPATN